ncbi:MAG: FAD-dependent monooxygenase [Burkholderiaceae bacterium]|nr:FAD-dependent monooxygenase [Burkholderiaceae bacterium]
MSGGRKKVRTAPPETVAAADAVAILGAGPIGLACALLLSARGIASQVLDARTLEQARRDRRLLALSRGTLQWLTGLLGPRLPAMAGITEVHVSSSGQFGSTRLASGDFGGAELGATVWYADLVEALARAAAADSNITVRRPFRVAGVQQKADSVVVELDGAANVEASIAISAEGAPGAEHAATHDALLADVDVHGLAVGVALERFTRFGPLALLPLPAAAPVRRSIVWCVEHTVAQRHLAASEEEFTSTIQAMLGPRIGPVISPGPRSAFALAQQRRARVREGRLVYVGNAAQSLHPIAGQGFNLGMRDCVCLADCLAADWDDPAAGLARYEAKRRMDRFAISGFTGALPRVFASTLPPVVIARSLGLAAFDLAAPLRRGLASLLMFGVRH